MATLATSALRPADLGALTNINELVESEQAEADEATTEEVWNKLSFVWSGSSFDIEVAESDRVYDLKSLVYSKTNVPPERQKILGLVKGKLPPDEETIANLKLGSGKKKFTVIGTPVGEELRERTDLELTQDVISDLDVDFTLHPEVSRAYVRDRRNKRKIKEATDKLQGNVHLMHPLREGKKLLVLDIDYTILDTKPLLEGSLPPAECARPGLHDFLEAIYPFYDICVWSQTSWVWLETKLHELEMIGSDTRHYKISFVLDKTPMFKVFSKRNGADFTHHVKALQIIWNLFPQYNASNTIHVDDLGRNFALNPGEGLKISAFKDAHNLVLAREDRELEKLTRYMVFIANLDDLRSVDHNDWKKVARSLQQR